MGCDKRLLSPLPASQSCLGCDHYSLGINGKHPTARLLFLIVKQDYYYMADPADRAEKNTAMALKQSLAYRKVELPSIGRCHHCDEYCKGAFCDADCRDDYEAMRRNNA